MQNQVSRNDCCGVFICLLLLSMVLLMVLLILWHAVFVSHWITSEHLFEKNVFIYVKTSLLQICLFSFIYNRTFSFTCILKMKINSKILCGTYYCIKLILESKLIWNRIIFSIYFTPAANGQRSYGNSASH